MKIPLLAVAAFGLCVGIASAQVAPPDAPPATAMAPAAGVAPPPPAPGVAPARMPGAARAQMPGGRGADRRGPPPPPSRAAHFRLEGAGTVVDVKCAEDEPMQACADIVIRLLDHAAPDPAHARGHTTTP